MNKDLERIVLSKEQIATMVKDAATWLDERFKDANTPPLAISVLKGSIFFFCDIVREMQTPVQLDFISVSSYGNSTESCGEPKIGLDLNTSVVGRDIILVEDIVDSGRTLAKMKEVFLERGAKSVTIIALFDKPSRRKIAIEADYSCCEIGDEFIVGYGLDYAQQYRSLPYIGVLKREVYEKN